jgi:hypothetical protein
MAPFIAVRVLASIELQENRTRLLELCKEPGEGRLLARVLAHSFFAYRSIMDLEKADLFAREALQLAERSSDEYQTYTGNFVAGLWAAEKGDYLPGRRLLQRASGISREVQATIIADPSVALGLPNCLGHLAFALWTLGYSNQAREQEKRLADLLRVPLDPQAYGVGVYHLVTLHCVFCVTIKLPALRLRRALPVLFALA